MPLSVHLLEGERKNHKKTSTEGYSNKAFSHSQNSISLHCHAAQLILTHTATGFLWIFKGAEMLQSWGKKPKQNKNPQSAFTDKNHLSGISSWVKHFIIFYAIYTTQIKSIYLSSSIFFSIF